MPSRKGTPVFSAYMFFFSQSPCGPLAAFWPRRLNRSKILDPSDVAPPGECCSADLLCQWRDLLRENGEAAEGDEWMPLSPSEVKLVIQKIERIEGDQLRTVHSNNTIDL